MVADLRLREDRKVAACFRCKGFYSCEGHASRWETPAVACEIDERIKNNWVGHPHFSVIDNSTDGALKKKGSR